MVVVDEKGGQYKSIREKFSEGMWLELRKYNKQTFKVVKFEKQF